MTGEEDLLFVYRAGIVWDWEGNFSKLIEQGSHRGASHRGTWTGCFDQSQYNTMVL